MRQHMLFTLVGFRQLAGMRECSSQRGIAYSASNRKNPQLQFRDITVICGLCVCVCVTFYPFTHTKHTVLTSRLSSIPGCKVTNAPSPQYQILNYWIELENIVRSNSFTTLITWCHHCPEILHVWSPVCLFFLTHVFANKVLLIFYDPPRRDANGADFSPWLGGVVFQRVAHMVNHPCVFEDKYLRGLNEARTVFVAIQLTHFSLWWRTVLFLAQLDSLGTGLQEVNRIKKKN